MQTPTEKQLAGLPVYAQRYIRQLEQRVVHLRKVAGQGPDDSNVRIRSSYATEDPDRLLGRNTRVSFDLLDLARVKSDKPLPKTRIDVHHQGVHQLALNGFPGRLRITPYSTNLVLVTVGSDF